MGGLLLLMGNAVIALELPGPLVESDWLAQHLNDVVVLDVRDDPASFTRQARLGRNSKTGKLRILQMGAHIPGARLIEFKWVTAPREIDGRLIRRQIPDAAEFESLMQMAGVDQDSNLVIVSAGMDASDMSEAARLYWQLKVYGHDAVALLNGGMAQWLLEQRAVNREPAVELAGNWRAGTPREALLAGSEAVLDASLTHTVQLIDNRPQAQYLGMEKRAYVRSPGHIPGARNLPVDLLFSTASPVRFRAVDELRNLHQALGLDPAAGAITYCNSGHLAAGGWFVLHALLGNGQARLYDGSMHQWALEKRPIKTMVME